MLKISVGSTNGSASLEKRPWRFLPMAALMFGAFLFLPAFVETGSRHAEAWLDGREQASRKGFEQTTRGCVRTWLAAQQPQMDDLIREARASLPKQDEGLAFDFDRHDLSGWELARKQFARGLEKPQERERPRDQSFQGLRDIIQASSDDELKALRPVVDDLERSMEETPKGNARQYVLGLVRDLGPLAKFIDQHTGIPAEIILAQAAVESGWGVSNVTILKSNILGLGQSDGLEVFEVAVDLGGDSRIVQVRAPHDTEAYQFNTIGDCMLYYVYILLQSPSNQVHYAELREYVANHRETRYENLKEYRDQVIKLIARGYHTDPTWYTKYLQSMIRYIERLDGNRLLASIDYTGRKEDPPGV